MNNDMIENLQQIKRRIDGLRELTQDKSYGSRVQQGKFQLVRVTYNERGASTVEPQSDWMDYEQFVAFLDSQLI